jgi:hypothetical protein
MSFKDIDDTMDEYSIGWVSIADMFDAGFAYSSYAAGDYIALTCGSTSARSHRRC